MKKVSGIVICYVTESARDIGHFLRAGVNMVQYRDKRASTRAMLSTAASIKEQITVSGLPCAFLINDRVDVALAVGADGVHVGQSDMCARVARRLLGADALIGVTVSDVEGARREAEKGIDYVGTDPVYPSKTKTDSSVMGIEVFREICRESPVPVVGIGGVRPETMQEFHQAGAAGVAAIGSLREDPVLFVSAVKKFFNLKR